MKKILSILLCGAMLVCFSACDGNEPSNKASSKVEELVDAGNYTYLAQNGLYYSKTSDTTVMVSAFDNQNSVIIIPEKVKIKGQVFTVTCINAFVFEDCSNLKSVTIGHSITEIGRYAFKGCSLDELRIGRNVKQIGLEAFNGLSSGASVYSYITDLDEVFCMSNSWSEEYSDGRGNDTIKYYSQTIFGTIVETTKFSLGSGSSTTWTTIHATLYVPIDTISMYSSAKTPWGCFASILQFVAD